MGNSLGETMHALQVLGSAVSRDNLDDYRTALVEAERVGLTVEQVQDAWEYRATLRLQRTSLPPVSFDWEGNPR